MAAGGRINSQILGVKGLTFHDQSKASLPKPIIIFLRKILNKMLRNFLISHFKKAHVFEILTVHTKLVLKANPEHHKIPAQGDLSYFCPTH